MWRWLTSLLRRSRDDRQRNEAHETHRIREEELRRAQLRQAQIDDDARALRRAIEGRVRVIIEDGRLHVD